MLAVIAFMLLALFLRSSSLPTGIAPRHLFIACNCSLMLAFCYLVLNWKLELGIPAVILSGCALVSIVAARDQADTLLRWGGWFLMLGAVGPLFVNEVRMKLSVLNATRSLLLVLTVGSLIIILLGIRLSGRGMFFGLMGHTMQLAPIAALATLDTFCSVKGKRSRLGVCLLIVCSLTCVGTGSRGAVLGLVCGILAHMIQRRQGIIMMMCTAMVLLGFYHLGPRKAPTAVGENLSTGLYSELMVKGANNTREFLWNARLQEFESSPLIGIGFQQQHIHRSNTQSLEAREPGSSYLATLAMTGVVGAIGFAFVYFRTFLALFGRNSAVPHAYRDLLRSWFVFFSVHMIVEGYIFACGSVICFLLWLTIGCTITLHHTGLQRQERKRLATRVHQMRRMQAA